MKRQASGFSPVQTQPLQPVGKPAYGKFPSLLFFSSLLFSSSAFLIFFFNQKLGFKLSNLSLCFLCFSLFLRIYSFIWKEKSYTERIFSQLIHSPNECKVLVRPNRSQEPGAPSGSPTQKPKHLLLLPLLFQTHQHGARSEVGPLELKPVLRWGASIRSMSSPYATILVPRLCCYIYVIPPHRPPQGCHFQELPTSLCDDSIAVQSTSFIVITPVLNHQRTCDK